MKRSCIAIVDAVRARVYTYQDAAQVMREELDLINMGREELEFAKVIVGELDRIVREGAYGHVIVVASPTMLGDLRKVDGVLHRADLVLDEIPRDLAKLTSPQLHDKLAELKLLPPR